MPGPIFLYDGDCAFCTSCARFIQRFIASPATVEPWQLADIEALGLTAAQCDESVQWVGTDGARGSGPVAIAYLLRSSRLPWRIVGALLDTRPALAMAWPAYRWVARNRHRMPGGTAACSLPQAERDALRGG